ncbi:MAG TPA: signal peptidase II [Thiolinea sp.]|nr:signal peptidase II [Thiolinea sp.]
MLEKDAGETQERGMLLWLWVAAVVVALDQLSKWMAEASLGEGMPIPSGLPHLNWMLMYNKGAAFSFLGDQGGWQRWFFAMLAVVVSIFIINWLRKLERTARWTALGLVLVLGGAIGNLIDRLLYGKVIDFIDVYFDIPWFRDNYHFATFNVADIAITLGAVLLVLVSLFDNESGH